MLSTCLLAFLWTPLTKHQTPLKKSWVSMATTLPDVPNIGRCIHRRRIFDFHHRICTFWYHGTCRNICYVANP